jgi:hypothetical protein
MKLVSRFVVFAFSSALAIGLANAQSPSPSSSALPSASPAAGARTEVYHVHFNHAAPGKAAALADFLKTPAPNAPMPGHAALFRHEDGAQWDYVGVQYMGTKATVEAAGNPRGPSMSGLSDWHEDTYVNGPSWDQFSSTLGLGDKDSGAIYVVSVYRAVPGKEDALEKFLSEPPTPEDKVAGQILMQHLEGAAWRYLLIVRYKSIQDYAAGTAHALEGMKKTDSPWFRLRDVVSFHADTLTDRIAP